jgi:para-aminobenzoate synthetase/4-amino-4-deoxychorismate lyase
MACVLLETLRTTDEEHDSYWMPVAEKVIECRRLEDLETALVELDRLVAEGYFAAGFLSYEAGFAFLPKLPAPQPTSFPLLWFGLSKAVIRQDAGPSKLSLPDPPEEQSKFQITDLRLNLDRITYGQRITAIKDYIAAGDTYQVNYTMRYRGNFSGPASLLYQRLRRKQAASYAAYIETDNWAVLSLSPELFFRKHENEITVRPMKGTSPRGRNLAEDLQFEKILTSSAKEKSENLMIVDLLRNDLGKICEAGTIEVTRAMEVERYETLLQMTSTIRGSLKPNLKLLNLMKALFPSGSVTGAPKLRTMKIIHELEGEPRNIYTGAIGFLSGKDACFNVAIRTAVLDKKTERIEMGVGSGILYEADSTLEYDECELKGKFLTEAPIYFQLIETLLWEPQTGFRNLELHLNRLLVSAEYFLFQVNPVELRNVLKQKENLLQELHTTPQRVRMLLDSSGEIDLQVSAIEKLDVQHLTVSLSRKSTSSKDRFLFHKTTHRSLYDQELKAARSKGHFEVLFRNERREITEGAITNVLIEKDGVYFTPPVSSGLLPGIFRKTLMESNEFPVEERVIFEQDVLDADAVYVCNSIRGMLKVTVVVDAATSVP